MRVTKWGDSLAVRLPADLVEEMGVKEGDEVSILVERKDEVEAKDELSTEEFLERMRKIRKPLPADYKFDRDEANAR